jgi:hypothetical protein
MVRSQIKSLPEAGVVIPVRSRRHEFDRAIRRVLSHTLTDRE